MDRLFGLYVSYAYGVVGVQLASFISARISSPGLPTGGLFLGLRDLICRKLLQ